MRHRLKWRKPSANSNSPKPELESTRRLRPDRGRRTGQSFTRNPQEPGRPLSFLEPVRGNRKTTPGTLESIEPRGAEKTVQRRYHLARETIAIWDGQRGVVATNSTNEAGEVTQAIQWREGVVGTKNRWRER